MSKDINKPAVAAGVGAVGGFVVGGPAGAAAGAGAGYAAGKYLENRSSDDESSGD